MNINFPYFKELTLNKQNFYFAFFTFGYMYMPYFHNKKWLGRFHQIFLPIPLCIIPTRRHRIISSLSMPVCVCVIVRPYRSIGSGVISIGRLQLAVNHTHWTVSPPLSGHDQSSPAYLKQKIDHRVLQKNIGQKGRQKVEVKVGSEKLDGSSEKYVIQHLCN